MKYIFKNDKNNTKYFFYNEDILKQFNKTLNETKSLIDNYPKEWETVKKQIHDYEYSSPTDLSGFGVGDALDIFGRYIDVESHVILENILGNDSILLEDGIKPSDAGYNSTLSIFFPITFSKL